MLFHLNMMLRNGGSGPKQDFAHLLTALVLKLLGLVANLDLLLDLGKVEVCNLGVGAVDDLDEFLEGRALSLDVEEVDEGKLEENPALWGTLLVQFLLFGRLHVAGRRLTV